MSYYSTISTFGLGERARRAYRLSYTNSIVSLLVSPFLLTTRDLAAEDRRSISEILGRCLRKQGFRLRPGAQSASLTLLIKSSGVYILANLFVAVGTELLCARTHYVIGRRDI